MDEDVEFIKFLAYDRFPELGKYLIRLGYVGLTCEKKDSKFLVINTFKKLLKISIKCDELEEIPISSFTEMYFCIIKKYFRVKKKGENDVAELEALGSSFNLLFCSLIRLKKTPEYCVKFLTNCKDASNRDFEDFLDFLSFSDIKFILDCFVKQRFHGRDIKNGRLLTDFLMAENSSPFCKTFIRYGFKYNFNLNYFNYMCVKFFKKMRVKGDTLHYFMSFEILASSEDIRMQLAIELLVVLLVEDSRKKAISLLWRSLPYNFITANELYDLLKPCVWDQDFFLKWLCDQYEKTVNTILPVPKVPEPRSLKHLSRVQVRNSLNRVHNLSEEAITELYIPETVKKYLWLNDF